MLTTSKPHRRWHRPAVATGLILLLAGCTPPGPRALLEGERLIREGREEDAIRRLRTAVEFLPANAQAWNHLGLAYHGAKRPSEASEAYQHALRLDRNLAVAYFNSGCLYLEHGEPTLATDALWAYVGLQPRVVEGWVKLGQAQLRTGKWDQAERSFAEALRLNPARVDALNGLGVAYQQRRKVRDAWQSFTNAVMRDPGFAPAWMNLGVIAHQSGANAKAAQAYRQYATLRPEVARQMDLASVIRKLESPPAPPTIQLPPAPSTNRPAPGSLVPPPVSVPPTNGATVEVPASSAQESGTPIESTVATAPSAGPAQARPPPTQPAIEAKPEVAEVPAPESVPAGAVDVPPPVSTTTQEVAFLTPPPSVPAETPPSASTAPAATNPDNASPASTDSEVAESLVLPAPVPVEIRAEDATAPSNSVAVAAAVVPVDRVQLEPANTLVTGIRDEAVSAPTPAESPAAEPTDGGLPPLVRPVGDQRSTPGTDRADKRGFWSRANPVTWFSADDPKEQKPEAVSEEAKSGDDRATSGSTWRWANPASWFRGNAEGGEPETAETGDRPASGGAGTSMTNAVTNVVVVATLADSGASVPGATTQVRRAQAPMWASRPVSTRSDPVREPVLEVRRYSYLRPEKPAEGNRLAAQGVLAQAQEEHRRDRTASAVRLYEEALRLDPSLLEAHQELAVAAMQVGDLPRALSAGETALALQPQAGLARLNFALALDRAGFPIDAATEAERLLQAKPDNVAAHLLLGNLNAQKLGHADQARAHYLRVIELEPDHPQSLAIRRWLAGRP